MNKTASQIGDIVLMKLSVSPELARRALLKRLRSTRVGVGDPRKNISALENLVEDAPLAARRALGFKPGTGSVLDKIPVAARKNKELQALGDVGELLGVERRHKMSPSGEYIERMGRTWGSNLVGKL